MHRALRTRIAILAAGAALLPGAATADEATFQIGHNRVAPAEVRIAVGASVRFENQDAMPGGHSIVADDGAFASPGLAKGQTWEHKFTEPGVYVFRIKEHPGAVGKVIVGEPGVPASPEQ